MSLPEAQITRYTRWLHESRGLRFDSTTTAGYDALWRWSVDDLRAFWGSIWDYFEVESPSRYETLLVDETMPGARWFTGAQVNYARHLFRHAEAAAAAGHPAIVFQNEVMRRAAASSGAAPFAEVAWPELRRQVASLAASLQRFGIGPGDRVCAFLPNAPAAVVAFLATASLGAIWSVCSPDMGPVAVLDRFRQIEPKVLITCDGYRYGGVEHDRLEVVKGLVDGLPSVRDVVLWRYLDAGADSARLATPGRGLHDFERLTSDDPLFEPTWVGFDHPLWVVYSSGTTGL
ncbi:MAG: AMP-binding protein, partial [Caldimonas sp.]